MKFDKERFAELLKQAKGERSINQYALHSTVSAAHISRLLRCLLDTPPNPDLIKLLADKASNNITYNDLMNAAGHIQNQNKDVQYTEEKVTFNEFIQDADLREWYLKLGQAPEDDLADLKVFYDTFIAKKNTK